MPEHQQPVRVVLKDGVPILEPVAGFNPAVVAALEKAQTTPPADENTEEAPATESDIVLTLAHDEEDDSGVPHWLSRFDPTITVIYGENVHRYRLIEQPDAD